MKQSKEELERMIKGIKVDNTELDKDDILGREYPKISNNKERFLEESENIISQLKYETNQNKARQVLNYIVSNYDNQLDYSVDVTDCIPFKSKNSRFKSVTITMRQDRLLFHFPADYRIVAENLLNTYKVPSVFDKYSKTQLDVKLQDVTEVRLLEQTIEYAFQHLK
jgi:hypothetical protein